MAEDGKKMSKSLKNYPDPWELMSRIGADALRIYMLSSPVVDAEQLNFSERDCETLQRTLFGTLWNIRAFYLMYAGADTIEITKPKSAHALDRWLMARLASTEKEMTEAMERYDLVGAIRPLRVWVNDLSTWWLRRSRERMKGENAYEKLDALRTLREALLETSLLFAPFAPFFAEKLYQDMSGSKMSVHLDRWPKGDERLIDEQLIQDMEWLRAVTAAAHEARAVAKLPVRQALAALTVGLRNASDAARLSQRNDLLALLRDEVNVERVVLNGGVETGTEAWAVEFDTVLTPELKKKGMARELSRQIMNRRKQLGLAPQDRIRVFVAVEDQGLRDAVDSMAAEIGKDVRAAAFHVGDALPEGSVAEQPFELDGHVIGLSIEKGG
jgi:isoleucyl-tRNA synthetase